MSINKSKLSGFILRDQPGTNVWRKYCELQIIPGKKKGNSKLGFSFEGSARTATDVLSRGLNKFTVTDKEMVGFHS